MDCKKLHKNIGENRSINRVPIEDNLTARRLLHNLRAASIEDQARLMDSIDERQREEEEHGHQGT